MFAGVERLAVGQCLGHGIHGLGSVVTVNAGLSGGCSLEPVAVVKSAVAKERTDFPAVNVLLSGLEILLDLGFAFLHTRSEEHTSELQSPMYLVCRLLLEKKKQNNYTSHPE